MAEIAAIRPDGVTVELASSIRLDLAANHKMLARLDLGYAKSAHVLQGTTASPAIGVLDSRETNLTNGRLFLINISRVRGGIELVMDNRTRVEKALERNPGDETSALETIGEILSRLNIVLPPHLRASPAASKRRGAAVNGPDTPTKDPTPPTPTPSVPARPEPGKPNPARDRGRQMDFGL